MSTKLARFPKTSCAFFRDMSFRADKRYTMLGVMLAVMHNSNSRTMATSIASNE